MGPSFHLKGELESWLEPLPHWSLGSWDALRSLPLDNPHVRMRAGTRPWTGEAYTFGSSSP